MKIALIQTEQNKLYNFVDPTGEFTKEEVAKLQREMEEQNLQLIKEAIAMGCDMIVTSEAINYPGQPKKVKGIYEDLIPEKAGRLFNELGKLAAKGNVYLVAGAFNKRKVGSEYKLYNSAFIYNPKGECIDVFDKIHLAGDENDFLTSGDRYVAFHTEFGKIGVCICWDMQFPETARELVLRDVDLIVCPTWGWEKIYGHARAYENGIYVAAAMAVPYWMDIEELRTPSQVVSPMGEVLVQGSYNKAGVVMCEFNPKDCKEERSMRVSNRKPSTYVNCNKVL